MPTVVVFALITFFLMIQPDSYEAQAVLMAPVTTPLDGATRADTNDIQRRTMRSATERLLATNMMLRVIDELDPYPELRQREGPEACVDELRSNLLIEVKANSGVITVTCIHNRGKHPGVMAADIANTLVNHFMDLQSEAIQERISREKNFLELERARLRKNLDAALKAVEEFKAKHVGELPDDLPANEARVDRLRADLREYRRSIRNYEFQIGSLERDNARLEHNVAMTRDSEDVTGTARGFSKGTLKMLRVELATLKNKGLADNHYRVKNIVAQIKAIEVMVEARKNGEDNTIKDQVKLLRYLMDSNRKLMENYREEIKHLYDSIDVSQDTIETTHQRLLKAKTLESPFLSLERDVTEAEARYDSLIARHSAIVRRARAEIKNPTAPIKIEQTAFVSPTPAAPDRLLTSLIGLALGLGVGIGLAITVNKFDNSYQQPDDLRGLLPGAVLVTIPEVRASGVRLGRAVLGILGGLVLLGIFAATVGVLGIEAKWWGNPSMIQGLIDLR